MSFGITRIAQLIVPEVFASYTQVLTEQKSRLVQSGLLVRNPVLDGFLAQGGATFNVPFFNDINGADRVSNDDPGDVIPRDGTGTPPNAHQRITAGQEIAVRLSRNTSFSDMDLAGALAGADPMAAIENLTSDYWVRRLQDVFVATVQGIFNMNAASPVNNSLHTQNDMTVDISGGGFVDGVTNFNLEGLIDAETTLGDSWQDLAAVMMHSHVEARARKNNLIDFVPDTANTAAGPIRRIAGSGLEVIVDDRLPNPAGDANIGNLTATGIYHTWLFGRQAFLLGMGSPRVPVEFERKPDSGNGAGQAILYNRVEWIIHPVGHAWIGQGGPGGPANGPSGTSNTLSNAASWIRVYPERKQIKIARLITRES